MSTLTESEKEQLEAIFRNGMTGIETRDPYWLNPETGEDYCRKCALKTVEELNEKLKEGEEPWEVDGGFSGENDGQPSCTVCGVKLEGSLTDYGSRSELDHFEEYGFDPKSADDCYSMDLVIGCYGWDPPDPPFAHDPEWKRKESVEYHQKLHALGRKILDSLK